MIELELSLGEHTVKRSKSGYSDLYATIDVKETGVDCLSVTGGRCGSTTPPGVTTSNFTVTGYLAEAAAPTPTPTPTATPTATATATPTPTIIPPIVPSVMSCLVPRIYMKNLLPRITTGDPVPRISCLLSEIIRSVE